MTQSISLRKNVVFPWQQWICERAKIFPSKDISFLGFHSLSLY